MRITREQLRRWCAGYTDEKIAALVPEEGLTPLEFSDLHIPEEDRLWVLLREDVVPARELRLLACGWAEAACVKAGWDDQRSLAAIAVARRFSVGEATEAERSAAEDAAWKARSAAWSAAKSAWSPRGAAAEAAAAASGADRAAAAAWWSVAGAAWSEADAESATRAEQLADVVRVLERIAGRE